MNFKSLMPLTLLVFVMSTNAYSQETVQQPKADDLQIVSQPRINIGTTYQYQPVGTNIPGVGYVGGNLSIESWSPNPQRQPPYLQGSTGLTYSKFMFDKLNPQRQQWDCPIYLLNCSQGPKNYSLQNTNDELIKFYTQKLYEPINCDYSPRNVNLDSLLQVADGTNVRSCYSSRGKDLAPVKRDIAQYDQDKKACDCLTEKAAVIDPKNVGIGKILKGGKNQVIKKDDSDDAPAYLKVFDENVVDMRKKMDRSTDGLSFQASIIGGGKPEFAVAFSIPAGALSLGGPSGMASGGMAGGGMASGGIAGGSGMAGGMAGGGSGGGGMGGGMAGGAEGGGAGGGFFKAMAATAYSGLARQANLHLINTSEELPELDQNLTNAINTNTPYVPKPTPLSTNEAQDKELGNILAKISTPNKVNPALYSGEPLTGKQCVSAREFMAFKQLPDDPLVQDELRDPKKMTPENWNYKTLRAEYNKFMARGEGPKRRHKDEILLLKAKLKFLERNPMFKTFLAADQNDLDDYYRAKGITDQATRDKVAAKYANIEQRKNDLMAMLAKMTPPKGCTSSDCIYAMAKNPEMQAVKDNVRNFFSNPLNVELTVTENDKAGILETAGFLNNPEKAFTSVPKVFTMENVEESFRKTLQIGTPTDCAKDPNMSIDTCTRIYAAWCVELVEKEKLIKEQSRLDPAIVDDLDDSTKDYFEADITKNKELADFNAQICETKRRKSENSAPETYRSFAEYSDEKCKSNPSLCDSSEKMEQLRVAYLSEYQKPLVGNEKNDIAVVSFNAFIKNGLVPKMSREQASGMVARTNTRVDIGAFNKMNAEWGYTDNIVNERESSRVASSEFAVSGKIDPSTKVDNKIDNSSVIEDGVIAPNYSMSNASGTSNAVAGTDQPQKVENMTDPQRQELLDDWQKEYDNWKKNKGNDGSPVASSTEAAMKARIEALEALLAQQKKLTEDQYRLLNDAIAKQNQIAQTTIAQNQPESQTQSNGRNRSSSANLGNDDGNDEVVSRGPASVPNQISTAGAGNGAGSAGIGSGGSSLRKGGSSSSDDSVAREEAKLVNVRRSSDGSITIEATNSGSVASANAVSVPVSDAQYRALQANPQSLNLSDLEKSIPSDQIAKLEKNGEITILLRNGSNPPFEVKVEKKNNKLVYSLKDKNGKDQAPVRRVFTRQALELQLKANR